MKRPSFQFYPADWQANSNLRRCTHEEKGIWIDVLCLLHDQDTYGIIRWSLKEIAQAIGCTKRKLSGLVDKGILKGAEKGDKCPVLTFAPRHGRKTGPEITLVAAEEGPVWYSSRMVIDEHKRQARAGEIDTPKDAPKGGIGASPKVSPDPSPLRAGASSSSSSPSPSTPSGNNNSDSGESDSKTNVPCETQKPKRKCKLPADFELTDHLRDLASQYWKSKNRTDLIPRLDEIFFQFTNDAKAKGKAFEDWEAAWVTWYSNAIKFEKPIMPVAGSATRESQQEALQSYTDRSWAEGAG